MPLWFRKVSLSDLFFEHTFEAMFTFVAVKNSNEKQFPKLLNHGNETPLLTYFMACLIQSFVSKSWSVFEMLIFTEYI